MVNSARCWLKRLATPAELKKRWRRWPKQWRSPRKRQEALTIAGQQSAKLWELRAATSLARLWQKQGKQEEARPLLGEI